MIFGFSIGSKGEGLEYFSLYIPFTLGYGSQITSLEKLETYKIEGYDLQIGKLENLYFINISPFKTIKEVQDFFPKINTVLLWISLKKNLGISYPKFFIENVKLYENPIRISDESDFKPIFDEACWDMVEGEYYADKTAAIPEKKKLMRIEMGRLDLIVGINVDDFAECITEALSFPSHENIVNQEKLQIAMALYSSHFYELNDNTKFIILVTVLEALVPEYRVSNFTEELINLAIKSVKKERDKYSSESEEKKDIESILSRIGELKKQSIGANIREYISRILDNYSELGDPEDISKKLTIVYNTRSKLLHEGKIDKNQITDGLNFLKDFVPKLLEKLYLESVMMNNKKINRN